MLPSSSGGLLTSTLYKRCSKKQGYTSMKSDLEGDGFITVVPEGRKDDQDKLRYDLIPPELLEEVARVLTYGAVKYSERNWEKGMAWHRPFGALMRHMWAWWRGENVDPETGFSHLAHAACCIAFLITYERRRIGTDDRHKVGDSNESR
jgi:hypothetical protein